MAKTVLITEARNRHLRASLVAQRLNVKWISYIIDGVAGSTATVDTCSLPLVQIAEGHYEKRGERKD